MPFHMLIGTQQILRHMSMRRHASRCRACSAGQDERS